MIIDDDLRCASMTNWTGLTAHDIDVCESRAVEAELSRNLPSISTCDSNSNEFIEHWSTCFGMKLCSFDRQGGCSRGVEYYVPDREFTKLNVRHQQTNVFNNRGVSASSSVFAQQFGLALLRAVRNRQPSASWRWMYAGASMLTTDFGVVRVMREDSQAIESVREHLLNFGKLLDLLSQCSDNLEPGDEARPGSVSAGRHYTYLRPRLGSGDLKSHRAPGRSNRSLGNILTKAAKEHVNKTNDDGRITFVDLRSLLQSQRAWRQADASPVDLVTEVVPFLSWALLSAQGNSEINLLLPTHFWTTFEPESQPAQAFCSRSQDELLSALCVPTVRNLASLTKSDERAHSALRSVLVMWQLAEPADVNLNGCKLVAQVRGRAFKKIVHFRRMSASLNAP